MVSESISKALAVTFAAASLVISGCLLQPSYSLKVTTADNVVMEVPLTDKVQIDAGDDAVAAKKFRYVPLYKDTEKAMGYYFELQFKDGKKPASIAVDDVSEAPIENLLVDNTPKLVRTDRWDGSSPAYNPADPHLNWVLTLDNSIRVYRFTVKLTDGTTHVIRLPILMPAGTKSIFRGELGVK